MAQQPRGEGGDPNGIAVVVALIGGLVALATTWVKGAWDARLERIRKRGEEAVEATVEARREAERTEALQSVDAMLLEDMARLAERVDHEATRGDAHGRRLTEVERRQVQHGERLDELERSAGEEGQ